MSLLLQIGYQVIQHEIGGLDAQAGDPGVIVGVKRMAGLHPFEGRPERAIEEGIHVAVIRGIAGDKDVVGIDIGDLFERNLTGKFINILGQGSR